MMHGGSRRGVGVALSLSCGIRNSNLGSYTIFITLIHFILTFLLIC